MRNVILILSATAAIATLGTAPAAAVGTRYPFCIQGNEHPGLSNCTFTSYEQCQATASGRFLWCIPNPFYAGGGNGSRASRRSSPVLAPIPFFEPFID
ncbi:DUF3551 domain-containing protein [Bradyrhizobium sp. BRP22]|uniref:DUF3551 domain-containing protein n=1 Tax=Bradyrhizobium sp. BRP22 TaxID=2793821 RepID=UPI001CD36366|nr:DUF3551 domain-containing protein [Bradyrhizobium sp. BRP22]MCA1453263.1 DUF3551 domain-containing protein [Bradyrhizobium sp. BRP22]